MKGKVDKLNSDKLAPVPFDLRKLSKNDFAIKDVFNATIKDIEDEIPNITKLATNTALTVVEDKIPDQSKYITTPEFNKLTAENFTARLKQANLTTKSDIASFVKKTDFDDQLKNLNKNVVSDKSKHLLVKSEFKKLQDKIGKLQTFGLSLFISQNNFLNDRAQLYLIFQLLYYNLEILGDTEKDVSLKSDGFSAKKFTTLTTTDNIPSRSIKWYRNSNFCLVLKGSWLKQKKTAYDALNRVDLFVYELDTCS